MDIFTIGVIAAMSSIALLFKLGIRRATGYAAYTDIIVTVGLTMLFAGTFAGMASAALAGLIVSIVLMALKPLVGAEKLTKRGWVRTHYGLFESDQARPLRGRDMMAMYPQGKAYKIVPVDRKPDHISPPHVIGPPITFIKGV